MSSFSSHSVFSIDIYDFKFMFEIKFQVVVASGAVKHEEFVDSVKKLFTKLSSDPTTATQLVAKEPAIFTGSEVGKSIQLILVPLLCSYIPITYAFDYCCGIQVRIINDDIPLAQFAVAFSGASWTDPDSIPLMVMQALLGSWNKNSSGGKHMG